MDSKKRAQGEDKAAIHPVLPADGSVPPSPARTVSKAPLRDPAAPRADDESVDIGVGGVDDDDEDDDDDKVERFYALLANIRAMRGLLPPCVASASSSCGGGGDAAAASGARKRLRAEEPPWRPAFRMEDFEAAPAAPSKRERTRNAADADADDQGESARPAVVVAPSPSQPHAAARCDSGSNNFKD